MTGTDPSGGDASARRRRAALAGHRGDEEGARALLRDPEPAVRATALGALARMGVSAAADVASALTDPSPVVRRRGCEVSAVLPQLAALTATRLAACLDDADPAVVEAAAWALGEWGERAGPVVERLTEVATAHPDPLCREAAVAALGAIGDERGVGAILAAARGDKPAVRRRAVIALAPFSGPEVEAALERALSDRDWQVRQAAEDLRAEG
jgi:HEAT repeat protein